MPLLEKVTVTTLEMTEPEQLRPADPVPEAELQLVEAAEPSPELARWLYGTVGHDWYWTERTVWTLERWDRWLHEAHVRTWLASHRGTPAGYFQLAFQDDGAVEIAYFGFLPQFVGRGWGGWLLTVATRQAWWQGATRVWLHTCTLDHPAALPNYRRRGFTIVDEKQELRELGRRQAEEEPD